MFLASPWECSYRGSLCDSLLSASYELGAVIRAVYSLVTILQGLHWNSVNAYSIDKQDKSISSVLCFVVKIFQDSVNTFSYTGVDPKLFFTADAAWYKQDLEFSQYGFFFLLDLKQIRFSVP